VNPHDERELLASDGVHHRLEDARKARRAHADKPLGERVELIVVLGEPIETREVSPESEHAVKDDAGFGNRSPVNSATVRAQLGGETRLPKWPDLTERHFDGSTSQNKHAPVVLAIKVVDSIVRASTKHPGREVEAERGRRVQLEPLQHGHACRDRLFLLAPTNRIDSSVPTRHCPLIVCLHPEREVGGLRHTAQVPRRVPDRLAVDLAHSGNREHPRSSVLSQYVARPADWRGH